MHDRMEFFEGSHIPEPNSGCWLWTKGLFNSGYGSLYLNGKSELAHRFAWRLHKGPIPIGLCVLHRCDVPSCVNPEHLFVGTKADNNIDMIAKGRARKRGLRGEENPKARLTASQADEIRKRHSLGETQARLGKVYGVTQATIWRVVHSHSWKGLS